MTAKKTAFIVAPILAGLCFAATARPANAQCYYRYVAAPVYYAPAPVYYAPAPVYYAPAPVVVSAPVRYVTYAAPVAHYGPVYPTYVSVGHHHDRYYRSCGSSGFGFSFGYRH